eukprot:UN09498
MDSSRAYQRVLPIEFSWSRTPHPFIKQGQVKSSQVYIVIDSNIIRYEEGKKF